LIAEIIAIIVLIGLAALFSGFAIVTFITISLFFKKEICFHEQNKLILCFELFLDFCGLTALIVCSLVLMGAA